MYVFTILRAPGNEEGKLALELLTQSLPKERKFAYIEQKIKANKEIRVPNCVARSANIQGQKE